MLNIKDVAEKFGQSKNIDVIEIPGIEPAIAIVRPHSKPDIGVPVYLEVCIDPNKGSLFFKSLRAGFEPVFSDEIFTVVCACCIKNNTVEAIENACMSNGISTVIMRKYADFKMILETEVTFLCQQNSHDHVDLEFEEFIFRE